MPNYYVDDDGVEARSNRVSLRFLLRFAEMAAGDCTDSAGIRRLLRLVVRELGGHMGASQGTVALRVANFPIAVRWTNREGDDGEVIELDPPQSRRLDYSLNSLALSTHIYTPVIVHGEAVGLLDFYPSPGKQQFFSPEKQIVDATAQMLSLLYQRATFKADRAIFVSQAIADARRDVMLRKLRELTEQVCDDLHDFGSCVLRLVCSGIGCEAGVLRLQHGASRRVEASDGEDGALMQELRRLLDQNEAAIVNERKARYLSCRPGRTGQDKGPPATALICPLTRLTGKTGVMAVARNGKDVHFSTVEANALEIACALVWDPPPSDDGGRPSPVGSDSPLSQ